MTSEMKEAAIHKKKRFPLWLKLLLGVVVILIAAVIGARLFIGSQAGRSLVESRLESLDVQGQSLQLDGFKGDLLNSVSIEKVTVRDSDGVWAEIQNLRLHWSPMALIGRKMQIETLSADAFEVYRRPILEPSDKKETTSSGETPLKAINLDDFGIRRVFLQEGVFPREVDGSLSASLTWAPDKAKADIEVLPVREGGDKLISTVNWNRKSPLKGDIELTGPAGGLFASLLKLNPQQDVAMTFTATGDQETVDAKLNASIAGDEWLKLTVSPEDGRHNFSGDIRLPAHPFTADFVGRLGDVLSVTGNLELSDPLSSLNLLAQTETFSVDVRDIRQSDNGQSGFIRLRVSKPDQLIASDAVKLANITLDGDVGNYDGIQTFEGQIRATEIEANSAQLDQISGPVSVRREGDGLELVSDFRAEKVRINRGEKPISLPWLNLTSDINYNTAAKKLTITSARARTAKSELTAKGTTLVSGKFPSDATGRLNLDLTEFGLYETGKIKGNWTVIRGSKASSNLKLDLQATGLSDDNADLAKWVGQQIELVANGTVSDSGDVSVPDIRVITDAVKVTGKVSYSETKGVSVVADMETSADYPLAPLLPGARMNISAQGQTDNIRLNGVFNAEAAQIDAAPVLRPALTFDGEWAAGGLNGDAHFSGEVRDHEAVVETGLSFQDGSWELSDLEGQWQALFLKGKLSGSGGDLEALKGKITLKGGVPEGLPAETVDLLIQRAEGRLEVSGSVGGLASGPFSEGTLLLDVSGTPEEASYSINLTGKTVLSALLNETDFSMTGDARDLFTSTRRISGVIDADFGEASIESRSPFAFRQTDTGLHGEIDLSLLDGSVGLRMSDAPNERLMLDVNNLKVASILRLLGRAPLDGDISSELRIGENGERLTGVLTGGLNDLAEPNGDIPPLNLELSGRLSDENFSLSLKTPKTQELAALVELRLPVTTTSSPFGVSADNSRVGSVEARLNGAIDNIMALVLPEDVMLAGSIDAIVSGAMPLDPTTLSGRMQMSDGRFEHGGLGAVFQDIGFDLTLESQTLDLKDFSALGRKGGSLKGSGTMGLKDGDASNLNLIADQLVVADRREGSAVASGTLGLEVDQSAFQINGDLTLDEGMLYLDRLPSGGQEPTLDVRFDDETNEEETEKPRPIKLDVSVKAPRRLKISGRGMDAELALDSRITGSVSDISIVGRSEIVRGRFELLGKRFTFQDSDITFAGDPLAAKLDILAVRQTDDFLAKVNITGTPLRPEVSLDAEPSLPDDEVLSRVLFGRSPSQLSGLEAARLAAALAQMSGGGGFDLMGGIEQIAGLDTLDVSQDDSGQFQVATGRYLSEDVYLEVTSNASGAPGVSVEWEARDNVSVGAETVPGEGQSLTIQWKKDFD